MTANISYSEGFRSRLLDQALGTLNQRLLKGGGRFDVDGQGSDRGKHGREAGAEEPAGAEAAESGIQAVLVPGLVPSGDRFRGDPRRVHIEPVKGGERMPVFDAVDACGKVLISVIASDNDDARQMVYREFKNGGRIADYRAWKGSGRKVVLANNKAPNQLGSGGGQYRS